MTEDVGGHNDSLPPLHVVTDDSVLAGDDFIDRAIHVMAVGSTSVALHVRGPRTSGRTTYEIAAALLPEARRSGASLLMNDRVDIALILGVRGVHLGRRSLPSDVVRDLVGRHTLLGTSVGAPDEMGSRGVEGADYVFVGTVFPSESHPGRGGLGLGGLAGVVAMAGTLPVIGIGGIGVDHVSDVRGTGVYGIAVIRGVWGQPDPGFAVERYLEALERANGLKEREA